MSRFVTIANINKAFKKVGIKKNDSVFLMNELFRIGKIKNINSAQRNYSTYLNTFIKYFNKNGTLSMNTYNFETLRFNKNFNYNEKKTSAGKLAEIFLKNKSVLRSTHPVFSISSIGSKKKFICNNNSQHNYGKNSPYERLLQINSVILNLGGNIIYNPFLHCAEHACGVPYFYNKIFKKNFYKNGKKIKKKFVCFMKYQNLDFEYDHKKIERVLKTKKILKEVKLGLGYLTACNAKSFYNTLIQILQKDIHGLLKRKPNYNNNQFPII